MIVKDMMPGFELYQPTQLDDALALLDRYGKDGWKMAGGNDSLSWFKERVKRPKAVIDISGIVALKGVRETPDGVESGSRARKSAIPGRSAVISPRMRGAGITGMGCPATGPAATHVLRTRPRG